MCNDDNMDFRTIIKDYTEAPISRHLILELLSKYQSPNDKISELLKSKELISIRRGLYTIGPKMDLPSPEPFLIANHLRGPSYVSLESALSYWNMIQLKTPYYSYGIKNIEYSPKQTILIASREKALCDKIVVTPKINLRSIKQTKEFLTEDLRMDSEVLSTLDTEVMTLWIKNAPKKSSLKMLIKTLMEL